MSVTLKPLEDRIVKTGRRLKPNSIEILEGLQPGDHIVNPASDRMTKGQKVKEN